MSLETCASLLKKMPIFGLGLTISRQSYLIKASAQHVKAICRYSSVTYMNICSCVIVCSVVESNVG